jgi:lysophospholipase
MKAEYLQKKQGEHLRCIAEENLERQMEETVEPYLAARVETAVQDGLYHEFYPCEDPKGTIVICYGFTEFCDKYHELIYYMLQAGYQVAIQDHRGHGKSFREVSDPQLVHVERFDDYVEDLHRFITNVVHPNAKDRPLYLFAHSMGGCIGALYLEQYPDTFQKAILSSPMLGINNHGVPDWAAKLLCRVACLFGKKKEKLFTMGDFKEDEPFETCTCNSKARHEHCRKLRREHIEYHTTAATYKWALEALLASKRAIAAKNASKVKTPVLLFSAMDDNFVRAAEQDLFLERIPNGKKVSVESRHEIARHTNEVLEPFLEEMFAFL